MKFLSATWIVTCDDEFTILKDAIIVFNEKIIAIDTSKKIKKLYPNATIQYLGINSIIMPGLINAHVHLEFSANKTTLTYGNFVKWLLSVIHNREELINGATKELIDNKLKDMIQTGTATIGAISSYGFDMNSCIESPLNVVYFTEALGSKANMIDTLFLDFQEKLNLAISNTNPKFIPAIAIHSPYSTHPFLIRDILKIPNSKNLAISAHYMESKAENDWLNYNKGEFKSFFSNLLGQTKAVTTPREFLDTFKNKKNLSFTHCIEANKDELEQIKNLDATIIHCVNSNRLLNNKKLNLHNIGGINLAIGTDGLSSNISLNMFEELKNALFIHSDIDINILANKLLVAATSGGAKALGLKNAGVLKVGFDADIITFNSVDFIQKNDTLAQNIILHTKKVKNNYIKGNNELL
jgi:cytosine/adenosine deaminase-related metal-dependent hydrolase